MSSHFTPWVPPKDFTGETVVVIGSGKSLTAEEVRYCRGRAKAIAVNDNFKMAPWADVIYGADAAWWRLRLGNVRSLGGLMVGLAWDGEKKKYYVDWDDEVLLDFVNVLGCSGGYGIERNFDGYIRHGGLTVRGIKRGGNSGYQAVQLAISMGAARVLLLGFDMKPGRWFGDYRNGVNKNGNHKDWIESFEVLERCGALEEMGVEIINCTPDSAMTCFEQKKLRDVI